MITTTSPEAFDEETRSRFIPLTLNESVEQTRAILARQRARHSLAGALAEAGAESVRRRHHNAQRLLRPLTVVNPYFDRLSYPEERLLARREQEKYLTLIDVIACLRQYRKEVKRASAETTLPSSTLRWIPRTSLWRTSSPGRCFGGAGTNWRRRCAE